MHRHLLPQMLKYLCILCKSYLDQCSLLHKRNFKHFCVSFHESALFFTLYLPLLQRLCVVLLQMNVHQTWMQTLFCFFHVSSFRVLLEKWTCIPNTTPQRIFSSFFSMSMGTESTQLFMLYQFSTNVQIYIFIGETQEIQLCVCACLCTHL